LEKSLLYEPKIPLTHMLLGYAGRSLNRYDEAKMEFQEALKLGSDAVAPARVYLAEIFAHEGKFKDAADEIRAYLNINSIASNAESLKKLDADWQARGR
jgi:tetratricopeptide (TPR) repeat protein